MNRQLGFDGRRVLVVGLGASGFSAARTLLGLDARVFVTEASDSDEVREHAARLEALGATVEIGGHDLDRLTGDLAVVSPGIPPSAPVMQALAASGMEAIPEKLRPEPDDGVTAALASSKDAFDLAAWWE